MAKKTVAARRTARQAAKIEASDASAADSTILEKLGAEVKGQLNKLKGRFTEYAKAFASVMGKRDEIAEDLVGLFGICKGKVPSLSFVRFVALLDPSIPFAQRDTKMGDDGETLEGYRDHPAYQAAEYCRRKVEGRGRTRGGASVAKINAVERMARVIATIIPFVRDEGQLWTAIKSELGLDDRAFTRLKNAVKQTEPLFRVPDLTPARRVPVRVIHIVPKPKEAAAA